MRKLERVIDTEGLSELEELRDVMRLPDTGEIMEKINEIVEWINSKEDQLL